MLGLAKFQPEDGMHLAADDHQIVFKTQNSGMSVWLSCEFLEVMGGSLNRKFERMVSLKTQRDSLLQLQGHNKN